MTVPPDSSAHPASTSPVPIFPGSPEPAWSRPGSADPGRSGDGSSDPGSAYPTAPSHNGSNNRPWPGGSFPAFGAEPVPAEPDNRRRTVLVSVGIALVVAAIGLGLGYVWAHIAPRVAVVRVEGGFVYGDSEPEQAVAADGLFALLGLVAGVVVTLLAWFLLRRYRGVAMLIGLVVGSLGAAWLAWWFGVRIGYAQFDVARSTAAIGDRIDAPLGLRLTNLNRSLLWPPKITGVAAAQAFAVAITYTMLAGFSAYPALRGPDRLAPPPEYAADPLASPEHPAEEQPTSEHGEDPPPRPDEPRSP